nr:Chain C, Nucleoprotein peptide [Influenza B virus]
VVRPSVASK